MWQAPNQRVRAIANAKKRERERARKKIHIKRIDATLSLSKNDPDGQVFEVRILLNDIDVKSIQFFTKKPFLVGQEVCIKIGSPDPLSIRARIAFCQTYGVNSHVLSSQSFSYRLGGEVLFESSEEESKMIHFCNELRSKHLYPQNVTSLPKP